MKKCPECGNPSYDGAPVCGNCGYKFPKPKVIAPKHEDIFQKEEKVEKKSDNEDTISILKRKKLVIGIIVLITLIVICGIVLTGSNTNSPNSPSLQLNDMMEYKEGDFSFKYPKNWKEVNITDSTHPGAKFFQNDDNVIIEYYNVSTSATSLKEITLQRIDYAQQQGAYVELVETINLDGRNASNIIVENADGNYTRFVSMFSDGELFVFKISGDSVNSITSDQINGTINSADLI